MTNPQFWDELNADVTGLQETGIVEVALHGWGKEGLVPMWFGESDTKTPDFICDAAAKAMREGRTFYTDQRGIKPLRESLSRYHKRYFDVDLSGEEVTLVNSGMFALHLAMDILISPGDEVVVLGPIWPNIYSSVKYHGAVSKHVSLELKEDGFELDLDKLFSAVTDKTKAIFINSPGNPSGWMMELEQMREVLEFARSRGIWIIADEVYHHLVFDREVAPSFLQVAERDDRVIAINSFSKSWYMTGWRMGWMVHPPSLVSQISKIVQITTSGVPEFLQMAAIAALDDGDHVIKDLKQTVMTARDITFDKLESWPGVTCVRPKAAFYAFFKVDGMKDSVEMCKRIIDEANVGLAPGSAFGPSGGDYIRLCYALKEPTLREGLERLEAVLGEGSDQAR